MPARTWRSAALYALDLCLGAAGLAMLIAAAAGLVAGAAPALDPMTSFAPLILVVAPALLLAALVRGGAPLARVAAAGFALAFSASAWLARDDLAIGLGLGDRGGVSTSADEAQIKLVTMNVWDNNPDPARAAEFLRAENADVLVLQEAREGFVKRLSRMLPEYRTGVTCAYESYCGVVIFARAAASLDSGGEAIVWPPTAQGKSSPLSYAAATLTIRGRSGPIHTPILAVHVARTTTVGPAHGQLHALAACLAGAQDVNDMLMAGDFNAAPTSFALRAFDHAVALRRVTHLIRTWPTSAAFGGAPAPALFAIDQIYAGRNWRLLDIRRSDEGGSDHFALIARLAWRDAAAAPRAPEAGQAARPVNEASR